MFNENHNSHEEFKPGFWQLPFIQDTLPFLTSIVLHVSLIVMGLLIGSVIKDGLPPIFGREQTFIPNTEVLPEGPVGGIPHPGPFADPTRDVYQSVFHEVPREPGIADKQGPSLQKTIMGGGGPGEQEGSFLMGIGPGGGKGKSIGSGKGNKFGGGKDDDDGPLAPFGVPGGGGGPGPRSVFIGTSGSAHRIAYVCDASGSMLNMFDNLRGEIRKSVDNLKPVQSFNVIFFQENGLQAADKSALMPANPASKRKAFDFLETMFVKGETNPIPALELAFKQNPELIFLLTDGDFNGPGNAAVVKFCQNRTGDGKIKINTIAFISKDEKDNPQDLEFVKALRDIATNSGGQFRHITDEDMGK